MQKAHRASGSARNQSGQGSLGETSTSPSFLHSPQGLPDIKDQGSLSFSLTSQDSGISDWPQQSPDSFEDKENCDQSNFGHHRQRSVIIKPGVEQSYSHILKVLGGHDKPVPEVPVIEVDLGEKAYCTPQPSAQKHNSFTSPYGGTTNHTESNHFEIDLFDSPAPAALGALPVRTYCPRCLVDVSTSVSLQMPRLPL